jgi:2-dehydro-3-deoxygluconokinase
VPVNAVDPVGAGDAFAGAYLAARLRGARPLESARLGATIAARVVAAAGDTEGLPDAATAAEYLSAATASRRAGSRRPCS